MTTPIKVDEAKAALSLFLDDAGIADPTARYIALNRQYANTWLDYLTRAGLAEGLDVWDVIAGKDALTVDLLMAMPIGAGKSHAGAVLSGRTAMLEVQP